MNYQDDSFKTHQPRVIYDQARGSQSLFWDANGNLSQTVDCKTGAASINFWDEENRLRLAVNPKFVGYYGYDANGERVYKLTGSTQYDDLNGSNPSFGIIFDGLTVYPSPYIVLTEKQYTKHYYAGTEKIATMIGDGGLLLAANHISNEQRSLIKDGFYRSFEPTAFQYEKTPNIDIEGKYQSQLEYACGYIDQANLYLMSNFPMLEPMMHIWQNSNGCRNEIYYTHGDHLGSANWITDIKGNPIQYIHYAPYGELIANQQTIGYDERFKFTGKERDWETGYDYFGARFYWSADGIFTTVDPLADKYPGNTPYLYCGGNPIMLVDPDGREKHIFLTKSQSYAANNFKDDSGIYIFGHGNGVKNYIQDQSNPEPKNMPAKELADFITKESSQWEQDVANGDVSMIFLYACHAGEGDNSVAQDLSLELSDYEAFIIAPIGILESSSDPRYPKDGKYQGVKNNRGQEGAWGVYKNGKLVTTIRGNKNPTKATVKCKLFLDNLWQSIKNFFSHENE